MEVSPAAEVGPGSLEVDLGDRRVGAHHPQRLAQLVAHGGVVGVADLGPVEGDRQPVVDAVDEHGGPGIGASRRRGPRRQPPAELGAALQHRVGQGLDEQVVVERVGSAGSEHLGQRDRCHRRCTHRRRDVFESGLDVGDRHPGGSRVGRPGQRHVDSVERPRHRSASADPDDDAGKHGAPLEPVDLTGSVEIDHQQRPFNQGPQDLGETVLRGSQQIAQGGYVEHGCTGVRHQTRP